jgi:hypothetical protein
MLMVDVNDQLANIAQIVRRAPSIVLARAFVRAYRDFCNQTRWLKVNVAGATVSGQAQYDLGTETHTQIIGVAAIRATDSRGQNWNLQVSNSSQWDPNRGIDRPMAYAYVPDGQIALYATPNGVYDLLVSAIVQPKSETVSQVPAECLSKYSNEIEAGALAYLLMIPNEPWTNPQVAQVWGAQFRSGIANAKADVARQHQSGSQRVMGRAFLIGGSR